MLNVERAGAPGGEQEGRLRTNRLDCVFLNDTLTSHMSSSWILLFAGMVGSKRFRCRNILINCLRWETRSSNKDLGYSTLVVRVSFDFFLSFSQQTTQSSQNRRKESNTSTNKTTRKQKQTVKNNLYFRSYPPRCIIVPRNFSSSHPFFFFLSSVVVVVWVLRMQPNNNKTPTTRH